MSYYAEHVIRSSTRGEGIAFWLFARPKSSMYLAEVAVTPSSIMISGDGPDLIISGGPANPVEKLRWFATSTLRDYIDTKVRASEHTVSRVDSGRSWDNYRAMEALHEHIAEADADDERGLIDAVEAARAAETYGQFISALRDAGVDAPWEYEMGVAPSSDVVQAREMVAALLDRIDEGSEA